MVLSRWLVARDFRGLGSLGLVPGAGQASGSQGKWLPGGRASRRAWPVRKERAAAIRRRRGFFLDARYAVIGGGRRIGGPMGPLAVEPAGWGDWSGYGAGFAPAFGSAPAFLVWER